jgi:hypothetical protein
MARGSSSGGSSRHCSFAFVQVRKTLMNGKGFCKMQVQLPPIIFSLCVCQSCQAVLSQEFWKIIACSRYGRSNFLKERKHGCEFLVMWDGC